MMLTSSIMGVSIDKEEKGSTILSFFGLKLIDFILFFLQRKLYIADARPRKNALANGAMGGGSESSSNYFQSEVSLWLVLSDCQPLGHKI